MPAIKRVRNLFTWTQAIRFQLALLLYVYNVHTQIKTNYQARLEAARKESKQETSRIFHSGGPPSPPFVESESYGEPGPGQPRSLADFPHISIVFKFYHRLTSCLFVYNMLKYLTPNLLPSVLRILFGEDSLQLPAHCYVVGRLVAPVGLYKNLAILHAIANLFWRFGLKIANRPYKLHLIDFIIQQDCDISDYCEKMDDHGSVRAATTGSSVLYQSNARSDEIFDSFMAYESKQTTYLSINGAKKTLRVLKVRPTRSPEAKWHLETRLTWCTGLLALVLSTISLASIYFIVYHIALDSRHLKVYPNCDLDLLQVIKAQNKTQDQWMKLDRMTPTRNHILMGLCDYIESLMIWFDSGMGITFVFGLPYILIYDLKMYWRHWNAKLSDILQEVRLRRFVMSSSSSGANVKLHSQGRAPASMSSDLGTEIEQLSGEIYDFFENFKQVELIVTDILTAMVAFWFLGMVGVEYPIVEMYASGETLLDLPLGIILLTLLLIYSIPLGLFTGCIFQLQDDCLRSYSNLNSLIGHLELEQKSEYLKMLELFNDQRRHQFNFLGAQRLSPAFLLTCISWTGTCLAMLVSSSKLELYRAARGGA